MTIHKKQFLTYWIPVIVYALFLFWLSSIPARPGVQDYPDKLLHFTAYFFLAFLLCRALTQQYPERTEFHRLLLVAILASAYGATDEFHQIFVAGRHASFLDWFADVAGILGMLTLRISRVKWRGDAVRYESI